MRQVVLGQRDNPAQVPLMARRLPEVMNLEQAVEEEERLLDCAKAIILHVARIDLQGQQMAAMKSVDDFFSHSSTAVARPAHSADRVQIDVDDLDLIGVHFLGKVQVLVVAADHLQFHYWMIVNLEAVYIAFYIAILIAL